MRRQLRTQKCRIVHLALASLVTSPETLTLTFIARSSYVMMLSSPLYNSLCKWSFILDTAPHPTIWVSVIGS
jgi:hypothetical protein